MAIQKIQSIARFIKIEHTLFSLPLIFSGVFIASKNPPALQLMMLILLGATGARTAALALNRMIDRKIDQRNPRTVSRELPSGRMSLGDAAVILLIGLAFYFTCAACISTFCLILSPIPLVIFTFYPYMKRFTSYAHFGVGLGLSMAPLGGWFAVKNSLENIVPGLLLALFTLCWVTGFDIIYSTLDEAFDRGENLYSFSSRYGKIKALRISAMLHGAAFMILTVLFFMQIRALAALPFLLVSGYLLYLEQKKSNDVEMAFFKINAVLGFAVLAMVLVGVYFPMRIVVGITGSSGALYAREFLRRCDADKYLIVSKWGKVLLKDELGISDRELVPFIKHQFSDDDLTAPMASGTNRFDACVILPCSTSTLGKIASGIGDTLITRTAQVAMKERYKLILCVRETPLSTVTLEQCAKLSRDGVVIMPISPPLYNVPETVDEYIGAFVDKLLGVIGVRTSKGWRSEELE